MVFHKHRRIDNKTIFNLAQPRKLICRPLQRKFNKLENKTITNEYIIFRLIIEFFAQIPQINDRELYKTDFLLTKIFLLNFLKYII